ncbi:MAG: ABC-F family ATP-binding cassette domain-containing protein [Defluviitaleaceae bacterium]|nr:ABC-F family ATP-binding cassette domain-containing protein [Defluviitaleaceae bacterium]
MILSCKDISKSFGVNAVLKSVSFILEEKEKAAVVGLNGAGKTTLFKILSGELTADDGALAFAKGARLGHLAQIPQMGGETIYNELLKVFERVIKLEHSLRDIEQKMSEARGDALDALLASYERATHEFESAGGYEYKSRIRGVLFGLGFSEDDFGRVISTLSGGQKTRLALAALLLREPDVMLLDEPTNHLDLPSIEWLEEFLAGYPGGALIISHDRYFLDRIVSKVIEIENGRSALYNGNYTHYARKKEEDRETAGKHYADQRKEIKRQEAVIAKLKQFNREKSIKRAESREKHLDKIERLEKPETQGKIRIALKPAQRSGIDVLTVRDIGKSFGTFRVFRDIGFEVKRAEKVALIGPNGIGKTTLFKILTSEISADEGGVTLGHNVVIGYYDQAHESLDEAKTVLAELSDACPKLTVLELRNALAAFMFFGDDVHKKISALSGGERGRVVIAKLMLARTNLLLLDEPTNHLDIYSREILEDALLAYDGTVLYISHDRYFISRTADKIIELDSSGATVYHGDYNYYLEKKSAPRPEETTPLPSAGSVGYRRKKQEESERRRALGRLERLEKEISELEDEITRLDAVLHNDAGADFATATELYEEKTCAEERLEGLYAEWGELALLSE